MAHGSDITDNSNKPYRLGDDIYRDIEDANSLHKPSSKPYKLGGDILRDIEDANNLYESTRDRTTGEVAQDTAISVLGKAPIALSQSLYGLADLATGGHLDDIAGMNENFSKSQGNRCTKDSNYS